MTAKGKEFIKNNCMQFVILTKNVKIPKNKYFSMESPKNIIVFQENIIVFEKFS